MASVHRSANVDYMRPAGPLCGAEHGQGLGVCRQCHVRHLTICGAFEPEELHHIQRLVVHRTLAAGQSLFSEEAKAQYAYNVVEGTVRLYKLLSDGRRQITGFGIPGDFLGLSRQGEYAYSAEAVSDASVCCFKRIELEHLFKAFPAMERRVLSIVNDELAAAQDQMLLLGRKTPREKVASFLLSLVKRLERSGRRLDVLPLPMTRADIADFLGLTTETVSRSFTKLRRDNIIAVPSIGIVQLLDRHRLEISASVSVD